MEALPVDEGVEAFEPLLPQPKANEIIIDRSRVCTYLNKYLNKGT